MRRGSSGESGGGEKSVAGSRRRRFLAGESTKSASLDLGRRMVTIRDSSPSLIHVTASTFPISSRSGFDILKGRDGRRARSEALGAWSKLGFVVEVTSVRSSCKDIALTEGTTDRLDADPAVLTVR